MQDAVPAACGCLRKLRKGEVLRTTAQRLVGMKSRSSPLADGGPRYTDDMEASPSVKPAALQPALAFYLLRSSRSSQIVPISNAS